MTPDNTPATIEVILMPAKYYQLWINGVHYWIYNSKCSIRKYLKRTFGIDLWTDQRIIKNYIEFRTKKVGAKNGKTYFVKEKR